MKTRQKQWLRWHRGTCEDSKFARIAHKLDCNPLLVVGCWALILEHTDEVGRVTVEVERGGIADLLEAVGRVDDDLSLPLSRRLEEFGLLSWDAKTGWFVPNWRYRQYHDDNAANRQKEWRERQRNAKVTEHREQRTEDRGRGLQEEDCA